MDQMTRFLQERMIQLRVTNGKSITEMAKLIGCDKATLSRAEKDGASKKTVQAYAELYCSSLGLNEAQKEIFFRGERIVVTDTSALLKNPQIIDELCEQYSVVIVPTVVIRELDYQKDRRAGNISKHAWQILRSISENKQIVRMNVKGSYACNDDIIIAVAKKASKTYVCEADILTDDTGFSAKLRGDDVIHVVSLNAYLAGKQAVCDMDAIEKIAGYYANNYDDIEKRLYAHVPNGHILDTTMRNGDTLIIKAVRDKSVPLNQRKEKIKWLISRGANVNARDCGKYYFPPLTHAIQVNDFKMFKFLLTECHADPNIGSRNVRAANKIQQKNEGNMPLMVAAWHNRTDFLRLLLSDNRTSINQQDANGFTALIKAAFRGNKKCMDMLIAAGADRKIVDRDGFTANGRYKQFLSSNAKRKI